MSRKISLKDIFYTIFALLLILIGIVSFKNANIIFVASLTLLVSVINFIRYRSSPFHFIVFGFILFSNYSICFAQYIKPINSIYASLFNTEYSRISICVLLIFNSLLLLFNCLPHKECSNVENKFLNKEFFNPIIVIGALLLLIVIFIFGFDRATTEGARGDISSYYEYSIILFLVGFFFCGDKKGYKIALLSVLAMYVLQDLVYGGRITSIQLLILSYLVFFFDKKINILKALPLAVCGVSVFSAVGRLRGRFNFSLESIVDAFEMLADGSFALDTAYAAFYASQIFVVAALVDPVATKLNMFGSFLLSIITGGSAESNLSLYTQNFSWHGGGGLAPFYMFYYLGYVGVILIGIYIAAILRKLGRNNSYFGKAVTIYVVATVPRWYLYSLLAITRGLLILGVVFGICYLADCLMKKKKLQFNKSKSINVGG